MNVARIVAIDGPSGAGKSTVSRGLAQRFGLSVLDTGAMYRAATWAVMHEGLDPEQHDVVAAFIAQLDINVGDVVTVNGVDVTEAIRTPEVTNAVAAVARNQAVRATLIAQQRAWATQRGGGVIEGRDITSVVFPDAPVRVYLFADPAVRAQRRGLDEEAANRARGVDVIAAELVQRDTRDSSHGRIVQPDDVPEGVHIIDATFQSAADVLDQISALCVKAGF
jgi:cytidylate kinase